MDGAFVIIESMDIEQLTKAQIVLLTLLVSFITSIATGIVTVALMDQAPAGVTQTINRVVERTVERVVPSDASQIASAGESVREVTVVVKENDLITEAIEKNSASIVRINRQDARAEGGVGAYVGLGFFVRTDGIIATDTTLLLPRGTYTVTTGAGAHFTARVVQGVAKAPIAFLRIEKITGVETFPAVTPADLKNVKLGQTVISLAGEDRTSVAVGVVTDIESAGTPEVTTRVRTDIADNRVGYGSPLFNMFGEVIGMHTASSQTAGVASYLPLSSLPVIPETL